MDIKRKKELLEAYKNRHPEMGVISYSCKETGEVFLGISKDTRADFNLPYTKVTCFAVMDKYTKVELMEALRLVSSIVRKCEKAQQKHAEGTSYHIRFK